MNAFAVILDVTGKNSISGASRTLRGFARVRVLKVSGAGAQVQVLAGSGVLPGVILVRTQDVYASEPERAYFPGLVGWLLSGVPCGDRPPVSLEAA